MLFVLIRSRKRCSAGNNFRVAHQDSETRGGGKYLPPPTGPIATFVNKWLPHAVVLLTPAIASLPASALAPIPTPMQATAQNFTQGDNHLLSTSFATDNIVGSQDIIGMPVFFGPVGHLVYESRNRVERKWSRSMAGTFWESRSHSRLDILGPRSAVLRRETRQLEVRVRVQLSRRLVVGRLVFPVIYLVSERDGLACIKESIFMCCGGWSNQRAASGLKGALCRSQLSSASYIS